MRVDVGGGVKRGKEGISLPVGTWELYFSAGETRHTTSVLLLPASLISGCLLVTPIPVPLNSLK